MSTSIYDQHDAAFSGVSAYVITRDNEAVGKIAFKYPRDGMGRLYAYVHFYGHEMVRGFASGCGYDKRAAAIEDAMKKLKKQKDLNNDAMCLWSHLQDCGSRGKDFRREVNEAGYDIFQAV